MSEDIVALMSFDAEVKKRVRKLKAVGRPDDWDGVEALIGSFPSPVISMEIGMFPPALNCWFGNGEFITDNPFVKYCPFTTCA